MNSKVVPPGRARHKSAITARSKGFHLEICGGPRATATRPSRRERRPRGAAAVGLTKIRQGFHPATRSTPPRNTDHQPPRRPRDHDGQPAPELRAPATSIASPTSRAAAWHPDLLEHLREHETRADRQARSPMEPPVTSLTKADPAETPGQGKGEERERTSFMTGAPPRR